MVFTIVGAGTVSENGQIQGYKVGRWWLD